MRGSALRDPQGFGHAGGAKMPDVQEAATDDRAGRREVRAKANWEMPRGFVRIDESVDEEAAPENAEDGRSLR